jgi:hypothetical protein
MSEENVNDSVQSSPVQESSDSVNSDSDITSADLPTTADIDADTSLTPVEKKEAKKMLKELEIKFNGKSEKVQLPFEIPEEHAEYMRRQLQMSKMSQTKAQEAAAYERDITAFINDLKVNPRKVLADPALGVDLKKIAAEILEEELANADKSPEELEREEYKRKLKEYEEKDKTASEKLKQLEQEKVIEKAYAQYDMSMTKAMEQYNIEPTPIAIYQMAHLMSLEIKRGYEPDMDAIAQLVEEKVNGTQGAQIEKLKKLSHSDLVKLLGEEIFERDRQERVAKVKKTPVPVKSAVKDVAKLEKRDETPVIKKTFREQWGI